MTDYTELYQRLAQEIIKADGKLDGGAEAFVRRLLEKLKAEGYQLQGDAETVLTDYLNGIDNVIKSSIRAAGAIVTGLSLQSPAVLRLAEQAFVTRWPDGLTLSQRLWRWREQTRSSVSEVLQDGISQGKATGKVIYDMQRTIERTAGQRFAVVSQHKAEWVDKLASAGRILINDPESRRQWQKTVADTEAYIDSLAATGTRHDAQRLLYEIKNAVEKGRMGLIDRAVQWKIYNKQLYNLKRISRTEMADAGHNAVIHATEADETVIGYQWRLSGSHKVPDICDYYASIEMGLGKGVFTKEAVPRRKAHPQCMCLLVPRATPIKQPGSQNYAAFIDKASPELREQLLPKWAKDALSNKVPLKDLLQADGMGLISRKTASERGYYQAKITLDEVYALAKAAKPGFDATLERLAAKSGGVAQLTPLKEKARAEAKIKGDFQGDVTKIRDVLRGSIVVDTVGEVDKAFQLVKDSFPVEMARNNYGKVIHSSDGYFDAKLEIRIGGIFAEVQIHTQAMMAAKKESHGLYEQRQEILRNAGKEMSADQRKQVSSINKQMRELFRKVNL